MNRRASSRPASNEEIMERALDKFGYLTLRVSFSVRDSDGQYKGLRGKAITLTKVRNPEGVEGLVDRVVGVVTGK